MKYIEKIIGWLLVIPAYALFLWLSYILIKPWYKLVKIILEKI